MGTVTAREIVTKARSYILQDKKSVRWDDAEALSWFNEFQMDVIVYRPGAYVKNVEHSLVAGVKQTLPADCNQLVDIPRNVSGRVIRITKRELLDAKAPTWYRATAEDEARHYMYSETSPKAFLVYPPNTGKGKVELIYNAIPADLANLDSAMVLDDIYRAAAVDYLVYRFLSKDAETADDNRASLHHTAYINMLTGKAQADAANSPNTTAPASK